MRCPKCGYISFDNVSNCLKCKKDISAATSAFPGSTLKVVTPSFLQIPVPAEDDMIIEGAAEVDGEIEFADPDLEILVDDEDQETLDFELEGDDEDNDLEDAFTFTDDSSETAGLEKEVSEGEDISADLGQFEDVSDDDTFSFDDPDEESEEAEDSFFAGMDMPDELADISDLSPPDTPVEEVADKVADKVEEAAQPAEPEDDLDFSNLDFDLGGGDDIGGGTETTESAASAASPEEVSPASSIDMDEDLDFDLDLGGLTIHEDKK